MNVRAKWLLMTFFAFTSMSLVLAKEPPESAKQTQEAILSHLPPAPGEFEWRMFHEIVFLKPAAWHELEKSVVGPDIPVDIYAASPEGFSDAKQFEMGFTLQIMRNPKKVKGADAKKIALGYLAPFVLAHKREDVLLMDKKEEGGIERTLFRYVDAPPGLKPVIVHKFIVANSTTNTVHAFTFESPKDSWDENWTKYGTPIFGRLNFLAGTPAE